MHLLRVQGFYFALLQCSPIQAFTERFVLSMQLYRPRRKTTHMALQALFLLFALFCRRCVAGASAYTAPPAPRWSVSQRRSTSSTYKTPAPRQTLYSSAQPSYYNKVYKRSSDHASPAHLLRGQRLHLYRVSPAGQSSGRGAELLTATAAALFGLSPDSQ